MHQVWEAPAPFCATQYINNLHYLPEVEKRMKTRRLAQKEANVEFVAVAGKCKENSRKQQAPQVATPRNIRLGESYS